jgi:hypothetical protein
MTKRLEKHGYIAAGLRDGTFIVMEGEEMIAGEDNSMSLEELRELLEKAEGRR